MSLRLAAVAFLCTAALATSHAQWLNYPAAGIPRTKDGKPNLTAPAPRANGKPDLSGVWTTNGSPPGEIEKLVSRHRATSPCPATIRAALTSSS